MIIITKLEYFRKKFIRLVWYGVTCFAEAQI
jgi:hypothetical protein